MVMKICLAVVAVLGVMTSAALAEPVTLADASLDHVTASGSPQVALQAAKEALAQAALALESATSAPPAVGATSSGPGKNSQSVTTPQRVFKIGDIAITGVTEVATATSRPGEIAVASFTPDGQSFAIAIPSK